LYSVVYLVSNQKIGLDR